MRFDVLLIRHAERDLEELYDYIARHDTRGNAARFLDRIEKALQTPSTFPERGSHPKELLALGIREYRQTFFKPYRLIYRIVEQRVYVYLIVDGRRDMQGLLARRLLGA
ncbi:MAG: type II toxin-antitoxin system RelE/ParE family toxin [Betaproteobacteria bacterium]|nr:type II toxin-antitoxin system RelE/ParE family toxin [Betaproteobacteria bacterium]